MLSILAVPTASATYVIDIQQVGSNVVATGSGSIATTALTSLGNLSAQSTINAQEAQIYLGPTGITADTRYGGVTGPTTLGTINANNYASSGSGPAVGLLGNIQDIFLPVGYVSDTPVGTSTDTFDNQSLSSMGLTVGTYTYTWGIGPTADNLIVNISVPEPTSLSLLALTSLALLRRRQRASA
jgi:hypothetical protein